ncbi:MAG: hypothetical protein HND53_12080 [Proteobacteria bacterium]|nr:hypothetical protein [Pseudomonadota bacterium]NOG61232.1 hypothetical protein [Pseudomonadota bacterium]
MQITKHPIISFALLIIFTSVIAYYVIVYFRSDAANSTAVANQEVPEEETLETLMRNLELEVINLSSDLPKTIDNDTRADSITIEPGPRLVTRYTYTSFSTEDFDEKRFNKKVKKVLKKSLCNNYDVIKRMTLGLIYSYEFSGNDGIKLATAEFNIDDC